MVGLEDQLLGRLISKEKSELEEQRQELMEEVQSYKKKIKQLEDDFGPPVPLSGAPLALCGCC
jgi:dynein heavy chain